MDIVSTIGRENIAKYNFIRQIISLWSKLFFSTYFSFFFLLPFLFFLFFSFLPPLFVLYVWKIFMALLVLYIWSKIFVYFCYLVSCSLNPHFFIYFFLSLRNLSTFHSFVFFFNIFKSWYIYRENTPRKINIKEFFFSSPNLVIC